MEICIDFDGTCVTHEYPYLGSDIGAEQVLSDLVKARHKLILFTMRSGTELDDAVKWFKQKGIALYGINENPTQKEWTESPKAYAQLYIDDAALGMPLVMNEHERPYVDWSKVRALLESQSIL